MASKRGEMSGGRGGWGGEVARWIVGLVMLLGGGVAAARGEITGQVESVGFDQAFRPGCWTPLVVRIRPDAGTTGTYQLRVEQEDLDRDLVSYVRTITLTAPPAGGGGGADQRFATYFLPQGARNQDGYGLPDQSQGSRLDQLNAQLRVYLCDLQGNKLARFPVASMISSVEPLEQKKRGTKLVLYVRETGSSPARRDLDPANLLGVTEDLAMVEVPPRALPTVAVGYDGVDAVVWAAGGPPDRAVASEEPKYRALREWLGAGGRLVVMQHAEWRRTAAWGDLLPVTFPRFGEMQGVTQRRDLPVLQSLAGVLDSPAEQQLWTSLRGPFNYGLAKLGEGAVLEEPLGWTPPLPGAGSGGGSTGGGSTGETVWLARKGVGAGCVTYVAQDLGVVSLSPTQPPPGWPRIWCRVLDYKYLPLVVRPNIPEAEKEQYAVGQAAYDLGQQLIRRMELTSRAGALVAVAVVFFVGYWLIAGPGVWVVLRQRKRMEYAWFAFAALAGGATLVTMVVVRVVLRGAPEMRHFSLVRVIPGEPTLVESRVGLYVPRDGTQRIALGAGAAGYESYVSPYALHPYHARESEEYPALRRYEVPVPGSASGSVGGGGGETGKGVSIDVPYRSTEKRLELSWRGELTAGVNATPVAVTGRAAIGSPESGALLSGVLANASGATLRNVFLVYRSDQSPNPGQDRVIFLPQWKDGEQLALEKVTNYTRSGEAKRLEFDTGKNDGSVWSEESGVTVWGLLGRSTSEFEWDRWFRRAVAGGSLMLTNQGFDDAGAKVPRGYAMLSLYDRLPFFRNTGGGGGPGSYRRAELLRPNARFVDVSAAVSAGRLVVVGQAEGTELPVGLTVQGSRVAGKGTTIYQFVVPLDRSKDVAGDSDAPATQPTTQKSSATGGRAAKPSDQS